MTINNILNIARKHLGKGEMKSSARLCLAEAISLLDNGEYDLAKEWALKSIAYSVGMFHADYVRASK
jgi:hypothetical protein